MAEDRIPLDGPDAVVGAEAEDDFAALHRWKAGLDSWVDTVLQESAVEPATKDSAPAPFRLPNARRAPDELEPLRPENPRDPYRLRPPDLAVTPIEASPRTEPAWRTHPVRRARGELRATPLVPLCRPPRPVDDVPDVTTPDSGKREPRRYSSPVLIALALAAVALGFLFIRFTDDSSFITWRYGTTWMHTHRWNWDPKGQAVEGYSSLAWAAFSIVPVALHVPTELFFKLVAVGLLAGFALWTHRLRLPRAQQFLLLATVALSPVFFIQLFSGAETVAFALCVTTLFAGLYRTGRFGPLSWAAAIGLVLLRPEGLVYCAVAVAWALVLDRRAVHLAGAGVVTAWVGIYWAARAEHFGHLWPNSFYVATRDGNAWDQFTATAGAVGPVLLVASLAALVAVLLVRRNPSSPVWGQMFGLAARRDATPLVLGLTAAAVLLGGYHGLTFSTDYAGRFVWQAVFPVVAVALSRPLILGREQRAAELPDGWAMAGIVVAACAVLFAVIDPHAQQSVSPAAGVALAIWVVALVALRDRAATAVAAAGLAVLISWMPVSNAVGFAAYRYRLQDSHAALGALLRDSHLTGAVALADAGAVAFELPGQVLDLSGRTDAAVAHRTFSDADLTQAQVQVVVGVSPVADASVVESTGAARVADEWARSSGFQFLPGPEFAPGYWLNLWVDPAVATPAFVQALHELTERSIVRNGHSDADLVGQHLFDFPFLRGAKSSPA